MKAELVWDLRCTLGEGCTWVGDTLFFTDIKGPAVHALTPATGQRRSWRMPQPIGWIMPRRRGGWVGGFKSGVAYLDLADESALPELTWLHRLHEADSPMRINDGKLDPHGHVFFGTMRDPGPTEHEGRLYRLHPSGLLAVADTNYHVPNGPTFSLDGRTMFHNDSARRTVHKYDLSADGEVTNRRPWLKFADDEGFPDGMTTDAEGALWIAHWGAGRVTKRDPQTGAELMRIEVPAPHTSNVCFGGPTLSDLYITSARVDLDEAQLKAFPQSGGLFVAPGAGRGQPRGPFDA